jgi:hypothetical protein
MQVFLNVNHVLTNVPLVKILLITVKLVPKTDWEHLIVTVISLVAIMTTVKLIVHHVTVDVILVLLMKVVNLVILTEYKMLQHVNVILVNMKTIPNVLV